MATIDTIERGAVTQLEYDIKTDGVMFVELAQLEAIRDAAVVTTDGALRLTTYGKAWLRWGTPCGSDYEVYPLPKSHCVEDMETTVFYIRLYEEALPMEIARLQAIAETIEQLKQESELPLLDIVRVEHLPDSDTDTHPMDAASITEALRKSK